MYARVVTAQGAAEQFEELRRVYRERVLPTVRAQAGFQRAYLLVDRQGGKALGVSLWDSEQAALAAEQALTPQSQEGAQAVGQGSPLQGQIFEVVEEA
jgi:heme-degrading monooxygenase HmoA